MIDTAIVSAADDATMTGSAATESAEINGSIAQEEIDTMTIEEMTVIEIETTTTADAVVSGMTAENTVTEIAANATEDVIDHLADCHQLDALPYLNHKYICVYSY
jgi:hypothetical protein